MLFWLILPVFVVSEVTRAVNDGGLVLVDDVNKLAEVQTTLDLLRLSGKLQRPWSVSRIDSGNTFVGMQAACDVLRVHDWLVLNACSAAFQPYIVRLVAALGRTQITVSGRSTNPNEADNTSLNVEPPESVLVEALPDIVAMENITDTAILYDRTFDLEILPKLILQNMPVMHLYKTMKANDGDILNQLKTLRSIGIRDVFLLASAANAEKYLESTANFDKKPKFNWYILTKDSKLTCTQCHDSIQVTLATGITSFTKMTEYVNLMKRNNHAFNRDNIQMDRAFLYDVILGLDRALYKYVIQTAYSRRPSVEYNQSQCYRRPIPGPTVARIEPFLRSSLVEPGVFGPIVFSGNNGRLQISLSLSKHTFEKGSTNDEKTIGHWNTTRLQSLYPVTSPGARPRYRVLMLHSPPFVFKSTEHGQVIWYGYCIDLLKRLAHELSFDYDILEPPDGLHGSLLSNGSWNGMINELVQDRGDLIVAPLTVMTERESVIDYTTPYYDQVGITILMKKQVFKYELFRFLLVLDTPVWLCWFGALLFVGVVIYFFDKFSPYGYHHYKKTEEGPEPRRFTMKEGLWFCMTSLTPQGGGEAPRAISGRIAAATWWLFTYVMIATYTANLAAFLTVSRLDKPIGSLDDLAKQFKTKYAPEESSSIQMYFKRMVDIESRFYGIWKTMSLDKSLDKFERSKLAVWDYPVSDKYSQLWKYMNDSGFPKTVEEGIDRVLHPEKYGVESFAFIGDATGNKYASLTNCELWEVGEEFSQKPYAIAVQEGSPLKHKISTVILSMANERELEKLKTIWWSHGISTCPQIEDEQDGISIQNIGGAFLVIIVGIVLGAFSLCAEYSWMRFKRKKNSRKFDRSVNEAAADHEPQSHRLSAVFQKGRSGRIRFCRSPTNAAGGHVNNVFNFETNKL